MKTLLQRWPSTAKSQHQDAVGWVPYLVAVNWPSKLTTPITSGSCFKIKGIVVFIIKIRWSQECLIFIMVISALVRHHVHIEMAPRAENCLYEYMLTFCWMAHKHWIHFSDALKYMYSDRIFVTTFMFTENSLVSRINHWWCTYILMFRWFHY